MADITPLLVQNFSFVGYNMEEAQILDKIYQDTVTGSNPDQMYPIVEEFPFIYRLFLTGRVNLKYAMISARLRTRHDLFYYLFQTARNSAHDRVTLEFVLAEDEAPKGIFYLIPKKDTAQYRQNYQDMSTLCASCELPSKAQKNNADFGYDIYAEDQELANALLDSASLPQASGGSHFLETIEISDCIFPEPTNIKLIRVQLLLGGSGEHNRQVLEQCLKIIDKYAKYEPTLDVKEKFRKNREKFYADVKKKTEPIPEFSKKENILNEIDAKNN